MATKVSFCVMAGMLIIFIGIALSIPKIAVAHCDTLAGPVVMNAKMALEKSDVTPVLKWVKKEHEGEIKEAFGKTLAARKQGKDAKELADMYFFETLVRLHRAGEGAPYTGLKQTEKIEPIIVETDKALESGSVENLMKKVSDAMSAGIRERFTHASETKKHADESVEAGREFVEAYVDFTHYVERLCLDVAGHSANTLLGQGCVEKHHHQ
jgi:hypothetical protein